MAKKTVKYNDFIERSFAQNEFVQLHGKFIDNYDYTQRPKLLEEIKKDAVGGDPIAQDFLAYLYKEGVDRIIPENFTKQLRWQILSGANGNEFAISKLQFYFGFAFDQIVYDDDFGLIKYKLGLDQYNYIYKLGKEICQELVKKLAIDPKVLNSEKDVLLPYRPELFRDFRRAIDESLPSLIENLKK